MDYQKAYYILFNAITDAAKKLLESRIVTLELDEGIEILRRAQQETEELYLSED